MRKYQNKFEQLTRFHLPGKTCFEFHFDQKIDIHRDTELWPALKMLLLMEQNHFETAGFDLLDLMLDFRSPSLFKNGKNLSLNSDNYLFLY